MTLMPVGEGVAPVNVIVPVTLPTGVGQTTVKFTVDVAALATVVDCAPGLVQPAGRPLVMIALAGPVGTEPIE